MVGALLALSSQSTNFEIKEALGTIHVIESDNCAGLSQQIIQLQPDVLLLDAYHASNQQILATYRGAVPWGYIVLICQQLSDLQFVDLVDEVWPVAQLADKPIKVLLRLAKLNRSHNEPSKKCSLTCSSEKLCKPGCYKRLEPFFVHGGRFVSPGNWGRKFFAERDFLLQLAARTFGISFITGSPSSLLVRPDANKYVNRSSRQFLPPDVQLALEDAGLRFEHLCGNSVFLLSLRFEGAFFPVAVVRCEVDLPSWSQQHVAETAANWVDTYISSDSDARFQLLQNIVRQFVTTLSHHYAVALRSFGQCVFCQDTITDQAYYSTISATLEAGIILLDNKHHVIYASDLAVRLLAREPILDDVTDAQSPLLDKILEELRHIQHGAGLKFSVRVSDDKRLTISASKVINHKEGDPFGYVITVQDETESQELQLETRLRERLASVGEFAAGMAHEIRNPLTSIRGFMQLLRQRLVDGQMKVETRYADYVLEEIDRANHVVTSFLNLAKPKDETWLLVNVNELLAKMLQLMESQAMLKGVYMTWQFAPNIPLIKGKPEALVQIFLNIATNALQATPKGGSIHILTRKQGGNILVSVQDSGVGMSLEVQSRIFNPFYSTKEGGTGLGLALCQRIIEEHRGEIHVESTIGVGSCFTICLPIAGMRTEDGGKREDAYC